MAGSSENITQSEYIRHHLQNLTFGQHADGSWGLANSAEEATAMGFWAFNVDTFSGRSSWVSHFSSCSVTWPKRPIPVCLRVSSQP